MKVNEAPEKIYLEWYRVGDIKYREWVITPNTNNEPIQYTRTDAFIKKVEDYLNSQLYDWANITNPDQRSCANIIPKKDFIDDFRNYMKGE